ncbi:hypothetical protein BZB76_2502 [Actinomadura pelletieri DSM 43383]|uniref:Uncharacterized protein n=1 Tax=Actinomadura pelletieri DSM 43383 TaxID=1120940 RepID=A0A495QUK4_9ACTN|nr:hypothetical protein [Actinomadura pelletieri]RKS77128.1 hypothetical protein BZB76_2502 [Actinomadura pelletieri DSM 43383]
MSAGSGRPSSSGWGPINMQVNDHARVRDAFGVVNGNVHIYDVDPSATPEKRFATALHLLDGSMPRRAEELIREAAEAGLRSHKVAYYWALAVLSGRSFDHLGTDEFGALQSCSLMVVPEAVDGWVEALNVITQFINCLVRQERDGMPADEELDLVTDEYGRLPAERREEIRRHLDLIMTGALQDQLAARDAEEVRRLRMGGDRTERAWKFFAPVPEPPRAVTLDAPEFGTGRHVAAVTGAVLAGGGALVALLLTVTAHPWLGLLFLTGTVGGGYLLATSGRAWVVSRELIAIDALRYGEKPRETAAGRFAACRRLETPEEEPDEHVWGESDKADDKQRDEKRRRDLFHRFVDLYVTACFANENPDGSTKRNEWWEATKGMRERLVTDLRRRYTDPDLMADNLAWLIIWQAVRAKERWEAGTLRARREELADTAPGDGAVFLGAAAAAVGLMSGLVAVLASGIGFTLLTIPVVALGAWIVYGADFDVYVVSRDVHESESALAEAEFAEARKAFDEWTAVLADRPTDAEMARWLDYDKFYAKELAMKACGLANRDLVAHAVLTEALYPCQRARVLFGPPRYSRYRVIIFLLTEAGVRQVGVNLDFFDGTVSNQRRNSFQYVKIASARVHEVGVRFDSGRRKVIVIDDGNGDREAPKDLDSLLLSQAFRLSLDDGHYIDIVVENFDHGFLDRLREDENSLLELAMDSSGVKGALRVLESVAAEGRDWLVQERIRRTRRLLDFNRDFAARRELPGPADRGPKPRELEG